jgi:hypothetical protein
MANKHRFTPAQMIAALNETKGMVFLAARRLGCSHDTILRYCKKYPSVQAEKERHQGALVDLAELKLWESVQRGEAWGISLVLKTLGRDRGYVDRQEITGKDGGPVQHAHLHMWEERLQSVHAAMAQRKAAILLERNGHAADPADPED